MAELLLVSNPRRRKRKNPRRRSHRKNLRRRHRRHNPTHHRRRARRNPMRRRRYHARRNPSLRGITSKIVPTFKTGFVMGGGAIANDVLYGLVSPYLTSVLATAGSAAPILQYAFKMLTAIGVGMIGGFARFPSRELSEGAAAVATHDFLKAQLQSLAPSLFGSGGALALSGYNGMGAYLSGSAPIVGTATFPQTYSPARNTLGAYLSGSSGMSDGSGVYCDDSMGMPYWDAHDA